MTLTMKSAVLEDEELARLLALGDVLIPAHRQLPCLSDTPDIVIAIDRAMGYRSDLMDGLRRGLKTAGHLPATEAAKLLFAEDRAALSAVGAVLSGAYLMTPHIRGLIGYPGQARLERGANDPTEIPTDEMLSRVRARGTICRPTPDRIAGKEGRS